MNRKGLSQILYLIIAASVLMMAALSLVFAFQSGVTGSNNDAKIQSCTSTVQAACQTTTEDTVSTPATCKNADGDTLEGLPSGIDSEDVTCSNFR